MRRSALDLEVNASKASELEGHTVTLTERATIAEIG
jgi:hypothetical protein